MSTNGVVELWFAIIQNVQKKKEKKYVFKVKRKKS